MQAIEIGYYKNLTERALTPAHYPLTHVISSWLNNLVCLLKTTARGSIGLPRANQSNKTRVLRESCILRALYSSFCVLLSISATVETEGEEEENIDLYGEEEEKRDDTTRQKLEEKHGERHGH